MQHLDNAWRYEVVRLSESASTWLDDTVANRQAVEQTQTPLARLWRRAQLLLPALAIEPAMVSVTAALKASAAALGLLAFVLGISAGLAALGDAREPINVIWALLALLLLPTLSLLLWLASCFVRQAKGGWLGQGWEWLVNRWLSHGKTALAWRAWLSVAEQRQAAKWWLALVTHGLWIATLAGALVAMLVAFSLRHYTFMWQTTWLDASVFVELAQAIGAGPGWLGFNVPEAQTILSSGNQALDQADVRTQWAHWLVGAVFAWGLLPRLIALLVSAAMLRRCYGVSGPLPNDAYALLVLDRLDKVARIATAATTATVDGPPGRTDQWQQAVFLPSAKGSDCKAIAALETALPDETQATLSNTLKAITTIDDSKSLQQALIEMSALLPKRLLVIVDGQHTPDRGTLNTLLALTPYAVSVRVYLKPAQSSRNRTTQWQDKLQAVGLGTPWLSWPEALQWINAND